MQCSRNVFAVVVSCGLVLCLFAWAGSSPNGSAFTYQGQLKVAGAPVNGTADVRFSLFDAALSPANQIGATLEFNNISLNDGLITMNLDFGAGAFTGEARWIEIDLRSPAGIGSFTTLTPRQPLTPVPYALYALNAPAGGGTIGQSIATAFGVSSLGVTSGTTTFTAIPGLSQTITLPAGSSIHIETDGGVQTTTTGSASGVSRVDIAVYIDGQIVPDGGWRRITAANTNGVTSNMIANWHFSLAPNLTAGQHTIEVRAKFDAGQSAFVSGDSSSPLQGQLTVTILKN